MAERLPSLDLIAEEVHAEREAQIRHADAVDTKAGIVLGFAGAVAALSAQDFEVSRAPGLVAAVLASLASLFVIVPRRFPTLDLERLRRYLRADSEFTKLTTVDTNIAMAQQLKRTLTRKTLALKYAVTLLASAVLLAAVSTLFD